MFFVATAPLDGDGHVNVSPKGLDTLRIIDDGTVAYLDLTGSGAETVAHVRENARITLMWCAFEGPPRIVRIHGRGEVVGARRRARRRAVRRAAGRPGRRSSSTPTGSATAAATPCRCTSTRASARSSIEWADHRGPDELDEYRATKNATSIDGLPAFDAVPSPPDRRSGQGARTDELTQRTASELLAAYAERSVSPVEVTQAVLDRIEALNPTLNAFCLVAADEALAAAAASEVRWQRGEPIGPLDGVPTSIKDLVLTKGWPTRRGEPDGRPRPAVGRRRAGDGPPARGRRRPARQDDDARVRLQGRDQLGADRHHAQPVGPDEDAGRLVGRHGGGGRRGARAARRRHRRRRLRAHPGRVLRQRRAQAELRAGAGVPAVAVRHRVAPRTAHDERRRRGADDERPQAARRPRLDVAAALRTPTTAPGSTTASPGCASPTRRRSATPTCTPRSPRPSPPRSQELAAAGAIVEAVDPGFDDPLEITTGLWFTGAWTLWNTLTPEQQAVTDPDFAAEAELGSRLSNLDVQRLALRRGELGSTMRQFMQRFDLLVTPSVAVPAFDARPPGSVAADARVDARLDAVLVPVQPDPAAGDHGPVRPHERRPADRVAARRADVRRRPRAARRPGPTRRDHPLPRPPL